MRTSGTFRARASSTLGSLRNRVGWRLFWCCLIVWWSSTAGSVASEEHAPELNQCGGSRVLIGKVGERCDPGPAYPCREGVRRCVNRDAMMCTPTCREGEPAPPERAEEDKPRAGEAFDSGAAEDAPRCPEPEPCQELHCPAEHAERPERFCVEWNRCGEERSWGVCSEALRECVCFPGRYGARCEHEDPCHEIDCGSYGRCVVGEAGRARCECVSGYAGERCEMFSVCQPGGVFAGGKCLCRPGYCGEFCNQCDSDSLCVPTSPQVTAVVAGEKALGASPYALLRAASPEQRESILNSDPPPSYRRGAFDPAFFDMGEEEMLELLLEAIELPRNAASREKQEAASARPPSSSPSVSSVKAVLSSSAEAKRLRSAIDQQQHIFVEGYGWVPAESIPLLGESDEQTPVFYDCQCRPYLAEHERASAPFSPTARSEGSGARASGAWSMIQRITSSSSSTTESAFSSLSPASSQGSLSSEPLSDRFLYKDGDYYLALPKEGVESRSHWLGSGADNTYYASEYVLRHYEHSLRAEREFFAYQYYTHIGTALVCCLVVFLLVAFCVINWRDDSAPTLPVHRSAPKPGASPLPGRAGSFRDPFGSARRMHVG